PGFATLSTRRMLMPTCLFAARHYAGFNAPTRKYPIYFPYPFNEVDRATIRVPSGYTVESAPPGQTVVPGSVFASYHTETQITAQELIVERNFEVRHITSPPSDYPGIRDFFLKVRANDGLQAVFLQNDPKPSAH